MSDWRDAMEAQAGIWRNCSPYKSFAELEEHLWEFDVLDQGNPRFPEGEEQETGAVFHALLTMPPHQVPLYHFTRDTCLVLHQAATVYPLDTPPPPASHFLSDSGFWYFSESVADTSEMDRMRRPLIGILWHRNRATKKIVFVALIEEPGYVPLPLIFAMWPEESTIRDMLDDFKIPNPDPVDGASEILMTHLAQYFAAGLTFCHQRIFLDQKITPDRAARRRAQAAGVPVPSDVHVITLRRPVARDSESTRDVDWQWRWIVTGHWRRQAVGSNRQDRETIWILPYMKGPDDKPVKPPSHRIFSVTR
jgi:hypothetical protein